MNNDNLLYETNIEGIKNNDNYDVKKKTLKFIQDVDTRWNSSYLKIERFLVLYDTIKAFFSEFYQDFDHLLLINN